MPMMNFFTSKLLINTYYPISAKIDFSTIHYTNNNGVSTVSDRCIENILNFARSYRVEETKMAGKVEMMLN